MVQLQQLQESFSELVRRGSFNPILRFLYRDADGGSERLQDAVAETWACYRRHGLKGKVLPPAIVVHHCRQQAVDRRRHFVPAHGSRRVQDAMDEAAHRDSRVEVLRLDGDADETSLARELCSNAVRKLNSAIDLRGWLRTLGEQDRRALALRLAGVGLKAIGAAVGWSTSAACVRLRALGQELAERCGVEIQEQHRHDRHHHRRHSIMAVAGAQP